MGFDSRFLFGIIEYFSKSIQYFVVWWQTLDVIDDLLIESSKIILCSFLNYSFIDGIDLCQKISCIKVISLFSSFKQGNKLVGNDSGDILDEDILAKKVFDLIGICLSFFATNIDIDIGIMIAVWEDQLMSLFDFAMFFEKISELVIKIVSVWSITNEIKVEISTKPR